MAPVLGRTCRPLKGLEHGQNRTGIKPHPLTRLSKGHDIPKVPKSSQVGISPRVHFPNVLPASTPKAGLLAQISDYRAIVIVWGDAQGPTSPSCLGAFLKMVTTMGELGWQRR